MKLLLLAAVVLALIVLRHNWMENHVKPQTYMRRQVAELQRVPVLVVREEPASYTERQVAQLELVVSRSLTKAERKASLTAMYPTERSRLAGIREVFMAGREE